MVKITGYKLSYIEAKLMYGDGYETQQVFLFIFFVHCFGPDHA